MPSRSPSVQRICAAAVAHFAERGYDAASLSEIADAVGIRKASLYTHFASKDALFLEVFDDALRIELDFVRQCFTLEGKNSQPGSHYCASLADRYGKSEHLRFLLRTAYLPPATLWERISVGYESYQRRLLAEFIEKLKAGERMRSLADKDIKLLGQAYLGIVDSLHVELIYAGGKNFAIRLKALQHLLEAALQQASRQSAC
ncbi:MAG: TetR/AcrR family transcriptional regulator [Bryobacterales bacterium]|nr:TetR/AcrR family transcriptional regulator [Bryobacterales bacterium]